MSVIKIAVCLGVMLPIISNTQTLGPKYQDALKGPVREVSIEKARLSSEDKGKELSRKKLENVSFDETGKPTERDVYNDYGFFVGKEIYNYDSRGLLSQTTLYDANGKDIEKSIYGYDSEGKMVLVTTYDVKNQPEFIQNYRYDRKRNLVKEIIRNSSGLLARKQSTFDEKGNIKEVTCYDAAGLLNERWLYKYDVVGNLTEELLYNAQGLLRKRFTHTYELDSQGNWVKRTTTVILNSLGSSSESAFVTYRTINYY